MLPHQRRDLAAGSTFTFSSPTHGDDLRAPDRAAEMEYDAWAERIKGQYNHFGKPDGTKLGAWTRRNPKSKAAEDDGSGTPSPELWKRGETQAPQSQSACSSPARGSYGYSHISHGARANTIAKYRQEMLDLVRGMPDTAYELSLRDIVESPKITTPLHDGAEAESEDGNGVDSTKKKKKKEKKGERAIRRSESLDAAGPFLKLFIPKVPNVLGGRKSNGGSGKVSPNRSADREWWSDEYGQMTSSSGSSGSSNSSGRRRSGKLKGCYPFFHTR